MSNTNQPDDFSEASLNTWNKGPADAWPIESVPPAPSSEGLDELDMILANFARETKFPEVIKSYANYAEVRAALREREAVIEREAQTNAIAWAVGVIDDMHILDSDHAALGHVHDLDRTYKGMKNTLRDRYKQEVGIDPAPSYPINASLKSGESR